MNRPPDMRSSVAAVMAALAAVRAGHLHDRGADLDRRRRGREPRQHRHRVRAPGLRGPRRAVSEPLRLLRQLDQLARIRPGRRVPHVETELHDPRKRPTVLLHRFSVTKPLLALAASAVLLVGLLQSAQAAPSGHAAATGKGGRASAACRRSVRSGSTSATAPSLSGSCSRSRGSSRRRRTSATRRRSGRRAEARSTSTSTSTAGSAAPRSRSRSTRCWRAQTGSSTTPPPRAGATGPGSRSTSSSARTSRRPGPRRTRSIAPTFWPSSKCWPNTERTSSCW